jgi:serine protease Do
VTALLSAAAAQPPVREVFRRVNPSVVVVFAQQKPQLVAEPGDEGAASVGSGVIVSEDGKVLTAAHVVVAADSIEVQFLDGERAAARVVSAAPFADVALLQLERVPPRPVVARLADSDKVEVGDQILVVGAPYGAPHSLAVGYVGARRAAPRVLENLAALETLQIDAAVYTGNSGGPVFNLDGEVVGVVSHVLAKEGEAEGLAFAVTSNVARRLMLEEKRFWTGVEAYLLEGDFAAVFNLPQPAGLLVQSVAEGSPSARLGLREGRVRLTLAGQTFLAGGDIILEILGVPVTDGGRVMDDIQRALNRLRPGDLVTVKVLRAGRQVELFTRLPAD